MLRNFEENHLAGKVKIEMVDFLNTMVAEISGRMLLE
jgi:hypothetical protein